MQKRYIVLSCVFLAAVVVLLLVAVNGASSTWNADVQKDTLETILESGSNPEAVAGDGADSALRTTVRSPYVVLKTSNYFTATVRDGAVASVDLAGSVEVPEEDARALAEAAAAQQDRESGEIGGFAWLRRDTEDGAEYAFVDVSQQSMQQISLGVASVGWGALAMAALIGYVAYVTLQLVRPSQLRCQEGARLLEAYAELARLVEVEAPDVPAVDGLAAGLDAGALALASPPRSSVLSLTDFAQVACRRFATQIGQRGGRVVESLQPGAWVKAKGGLLEALCMLLLSGALAGMREGADVHVDVLSDGRQAALMVRYECAAKKAPEGELLMAAAVLARGMGGTASFDVPRPSTACYTVRLQGARPKS